MDSVLPTPGDDPEVTVRQEPVELPGRAASRGRRWLWSGGSEPDPRFTLANERTFLAWIRTALALLAGGVALEAFAPGVFEPHVQLAVVLTLVALSVLVALTAAWRWVRIEQAMRWRQPLPVNLLAPTLSLATALVGAVVVVVFARR